MSWEGLVARMKKRNAYIILVGEPEIKDPLVRHKCKLQDNIKVELYGIGWNDVDWIYVVRRGISGGLL